ncbi:MAG: substrate-binding domain-containing protein [Kiritimatiellia bacterium]
METILLFQHVDSYAARLRLEGITDFAKEVGWNVQAYEENVDARQLAEIQSFWHPVGAILSPYNGIEEYDASLFSPESTVLLDSFPPAGMEKFATVITDSSRVAELAARELMQSDLAAYGFVPWPQRRIWSENRFFTFSKIMARRGIKPQAFAPSRPGLSMQELQQEMGRWVRALPKPCGVLAANDRIATHFLNACRIAGVEVPFECVVVGVDDNDKLCEGVNPTLSSIGLNFRASGYRAAEMLHALLHGRLDGKPIESTPPTGFTRRNSSRVFLKTDRAVLQASETIRAKACSGLSSREVLSIFPCSRRLAEIRFRNATGHSILGEIRAVRIENAKRLLANPRQRLDAVAGECGYRSDTTFRRVFKAETGMTLRQWQKYCRSPREGARPT